MIKKTIISLIVFVFIGCSDHHEISIIPQPNNMEVHSGNFLLDSETSVEYDSNKKELEKIIIEFTNKIKLVSGINLSVNEEAAKIISIDIDSNLSDMESGYKLLIDETSIKLVGSSSKGVFYGMQTLYQLANPLIFGSENKLELPIRIPSVTIFDQAEYKYRGSMLDVGRHFFPVEFVKKYIDILAFHKMNKFHWHLTEDQGWRIEIKKYPKLTEFGSIRMETMEDGIRHEGFYTQEDVKEILEYAEERFIEVIPEIELPGHSGAALAAYPEISCTGKIKDVSTIWGVHEDIYCAGNEKTFEFLQNVLDEVVELFPSEYIHIGGDEAPKVRWAKCKKCQKRIKDEKLNDEFELQSYFIKRIEKYLLSKGKYIIGWDEILEGGLAPNATVMSWRGEEGGINAAKKGHDVIMSPNTHCYFDYYQSRYDEPDAIGGYTPLEKVYSYEIVPSKLTVDESKHILGAQANLWTEFIATEDYAEYMLLPRLSALSEVLWTKGELRNFEDFEERMIKQYARYGVRNWNYRVPTPIGMNGQRIGHEQEIVELAIPIKGAEIKYTLDGTDPDMNSKTYTTPIEISRSSLLKARIIMADNKMGHVTLSSISIVDTAVNGVQYKYYEGNWIKLPNFSEEKVKKSGRVMRISIQEINTHNDHFAIIYDGNLRIDQVGEYKFYLTSDDGSKLIIDNNLIIDNDGSHSKREKTKVINLSEGMHSIQVQYFEDYEGETLELLIEGEKLPKQEIPSSMLFLN